MPNGILDQWLQEQTRNERCTNTILDVAADGETVLESNSLDRDVTVEQSQLTLEWHLLLARCRQHEPQKIAQLRHHSFGSGWICRDQSHCTVERVEQKMRIQLELERI